MAELALYRIPADDVDPNPCLGEPPMAHVYPGPFPTNVLHRPRCLGAITGLSVRAAI